jgi:hypothetical protein
LRKNDRGAVAVANASVLQHCLRVVSGACVHGERWRSHAFWAEKAPSMSTQAGSLQEKAASDDTNDRTDAGKSCNDAEVGVYR